MAKQMSAQDEGKGFAPMPNKKKMNHQGMEGSATAQDRTREDEGKFEMPKKLKVPR